MMDGVAASFHCCKTGEEFWDSILVALAEKKNNAQIYQLSRDLAQVKRGSSSLGDCYAKLRGIWCELRNIGPYALVDTVLI